jgi:hypothetical protein
MPEVSRMNWLAELLALYDGQPIPTTLLQYYSEGEEE